MSNDNDIKRLEDKLDKLFEKLDKSNDRLSEIDKTVAVYNEQLKLHIEGTVQNREALRLSQESIAQELSPIKKHVHMVEGGFKLLGICSLVIAIMSGIVKIFGLV